LAWSQVALWLRATISAESLNSDTSASQVIVRLEVGHLIAGIELFALNRTASIFDGSNRQHLRRSSRRARAGAMDIWTMRLAAHRRRPWTTRRCASALPTAAAFAHMPTALDNE